MANQTHPLTVVGIRQREQDPPLLILRDDCGRTLEMTIGLCEALSIEMALNGAVAVRPLTHDLLLSLTEHLETPVERVVIDDYSMQTYYARFVLTTPDGPISLDCRPSDGIAVALRAHIPIEATEDVILGVEHEG